MSKQNKKPVKKAPVKSTAKPVAKQPAKAAPAKKSAAAKVKPAAKAPVKAKPAAAQPAKKALEPKKKMPAVTAKQQPPAKQQKVLPEKVAPAAKAPKKSEGKKKKDKKGKDGFDLEADDLLTSDEEIGSEDIPDLSEFDENEIEEATQEIEMEESAEAGGEKQNRDDEVLLTDAEGRVYCRVRDCDQISAVEGYCRFHYLLLWKKIQVRRKILIDGKLERYVEELTARYPDKFLEMIRKDLRTEKDFLNAIAELEIDEAANDAEFEDEAQSYVDEMRGITPEAGMSDDDEF